MTDLNTYSTSSVSNCETAHVHFVFGGLGFKEQMLLYLLTGIFVPSPLNPNEYFFFKESPNSSHP